MLKPEILVNFLIEQNISFFSGVPDSLLKEFCAYVDDKVTKKDKENNPKLYKGKQVGSVKKTK